MIKEKDYNPRTYMELAIEEMKKSQHEPSQMEKHRQRSGPYCFSLMERL
jgi:hypothetical protein